MRAVAVGLVLAAVAASPAQAASERSETKRLEDRREVAAGTRAQVLGFQDGRFYANGWHITGEMGGIVTPPLKLLDSLSFGVEGEWVGPAEKFTSGWGYTRYELPSVDGLRLSLGGPRTAQRSYFDGRQMTQTFTMFSGDGTPLRAKVDATFLQLVDVNDYPRQPQVSSGTIYEQNWNVVAGDRLDTIAGEVYGDATQWRRIAEYNHIVDPLAIAPGQRLRIPVE